MNMIDLIEKKRDGGEFSEAEIRWMISGYTNDMIPDYQMSAMLMAICLQGMTEQETFALTMSMLHSGEVMDLSSVPGLKADKHSTGGVGDKTSLVLCPMLSALGVIMAKMSGRGLGHTGGTLDKLESFPGFRSELNETEFISQLQKMAFVISGQAKSLCPADKKLYSLRDVTGTVPSVPLIVGSIMSKKLAVGADVIVLDVKSGSGSFTKTDDEAAFLAQEMVKVGRTAGKNIGALVTNMDEPLGFAVGNALEVQEAIRVLRGETQAGHLLELCLALGGIILTEGGISKNEAEANEMLLGTIKSGAALSQLEKLVREQGGDPSAIYDFPLFPHAAYEFEVPSLCGGYVSHMAANEIGKICMYLGGGREDKNSEVDLAVGIVLRKKVGDSVAAGESLAVIHANNADRGREAVDAFLRACMITEEKPEIQSFIRRRIR